MLIRPGFEVQFEPRVETLFDIIIDKAVIMLIRPGFEAHSSPGLKPWAAIRRPLERGAWGGGRNALFEKWKREERDFPHPGPFPERGEVCWRATRRLEPPLLSAGDAPLCVHPTTEYRSGVIFTIILK